MENYYTKQIISLLQELNKTLVSIEKHFKFLVGEKMKAEKNGKDR